MELITSFDQIHYGSTNVEVRSQMSHEMYQCHALLIVINSYD